MTRNRKSVLPAKEHLKSLKRIKNPPGTRLGYLRLDKNENVINFPKDFIEILKKEITSDFLSTYPEVDIIYDKVAKWVGCKRENIYISSGSDAAIKSVFEVFVRPLDKVLLLRPTYAMFYVYTKMFQAELIEVNYEKNLTVSVDNIITVIKRQNPRLVCIANPNSPTGTIIPKEGLDRIIELAAEQGSIILLDEAYYLFYPISSVSLISRYPQLIVTRTFSKAFGLASARLGFACAHEDTVEYLHKVRPMYETNAFAVKFASLVLDNYHLVEERLEEAKRAKEYMEGEFTRLNIPYFKSYANFILINMGSLERCSEFSELLYQNGILVKSGFTDGVLKNCIRVSIGNIEQMKRFMAKFKEALVSVK